MFNKIIKNTVVAYPVTFVYMESHYTIYIHFTFSYLAVSVCFVDVDEVLFVPEDDIVVAVSVNITNPLSFDVTLMVDSINVTATGQYLSSILNAHMPVFYRRC